MVILVLRSLSNSSFTSSKLRVLKFRAPKNPSCYTTFFAVKIGHGDFGVTLTFKILISAEVNCGFSSLACLRV